MRVGGQEGKEVFGPVDNRERTKKDIILLVKGPHSPAVCVIKTHMETSFKA